MLITLEIKDDKSKEFLEFLKALDFVQIQRSELNAEDYKAMLDERLEEYKKNPDSGIDACEVLQSLKIKYGF